MVDLLKLIALDEADLAVISAHVQDAVMHVGDMAFVRPERRFAVILNRFDWVGADKAKNAARERFERRRAALRFEKVDGAQCHGLTPGNPEQTLELLALRFEAGDPPGGCITLLFAGGAAVRLRVECIEVELRDLGPVWRTKVKPAHPGDETPSA
jgi:hypothetical protein